jgi:hypothetical protein
MQQAMQQVLVGSNPGPLALKIPKGANIAPEGVNLTPERFVFVENNSTFDSYLT